jgi:3-methyladenine DNA glycosylase AlkD
MQTTAQKIQATLAQLVDHTLAPRKQKFFKTDAGQYAAGDRFIGITVPQIRIVAKEYRDIPLDAIQELLDSAVNEERLLALIILSNQYKKAQLATNKQRIYDFYCANIDRVNNWNLVDTSAPHIMGAYLYDKNTDILNRLAQSDKLWHRRIAIVSTQYFIKHQSYEPTIRIATALLHDSHDLIHKAVGWMLREVGEQDVQVLTVFLDQHRQAMPRTMLRYAIEKFPENSRQDYLKKLS